MTSLSKDARFFVEGVTRYLRRGGADDTMLPKVAAVFQKITSSARLQKTAIVESTVVLTAKEKMEIGRFLSRLLAHTVTIKCKINKELIAGLRIAVGDWIVDTSIATQIHAMQEQLIQT